MASLKIFFAFFGYLNKFFGYCFCTSVVSFDVYRGSRETLVKYY